MHTVLYAHAVGNMNMDLPACVYKHKYIYAKTCLYTHVAVPVQM